MFSFPKAFCRTTTGALRSPFLSPAFLAASMGLLSACSAAEAEPTGAALHLDKLYEGVISSRVIPPEGSNIRPKSAHGGGKVILQSTDGGAAQLVIDGSLERENDASFVAPGEFDGEVWRGQSPTTTLVIDEKGVISGQGELDAMDVDIEGAIVGSDLDIFIELVVRSETAGGLPPGTRFQFAYDLRHMPVRADSASRGASGGCKEVVYRLKLTPNLFGSGLSSVRVPECVN